ncbi:glycosyltransferase family 2 protein [candidate division WOR-3 bacterium]|nr:glycosyltransferase family 2 protein [candidate division WOR-3 bacterium]
MTSKVSIIIPAFNEEENIASLLEKFDQMLQENSIPCEVILVDDGSTDKTFEKGVQYQKKYNFLKVIRQKNRRGITDALLSGFNVARGDIFVYFPADLQYLPEEIPKLVNKLEEGYELVAGWKTGRYEKRFVSGVYNWLSRMLFRVPVHDLNSIKAFKREVVRELPWRKDWHRYIVAMAYEYGFNIGEVRVTLCPRKYGKSKFGFWRIPVGILDLIAVKFQMSVMRKPMLFFGSISGGLLLAALVVGIIALYLRFGLQKGYRPLLYLVIFLGISGLLLFVVGFLAEAMAGIQDEIRKLRRK